MAMMKEGRAVFWRVPSLTSQRARYQQDYDITPLKGAKKETYQESDNVFIYKYKYTRYTLENNFVQKWSYYQKYEKSNNETKCYQVSSNNLLEN